ncbi:putative protein OS=Tsukamurella paurometabola (strain ATCC 8368 / DSM / CCUG 35730 /CIP 100753 / JCM 10117 / KCTC 9821 / NBRC 16120 / NCIMB 702349/ NCTC 13040) OX=521096 GN=Tpau_3216 PE=4 SV=1 [Tsukamurella paurometabola]|uniref:Uncharacterized protein n=1 Tax=Tsukamurella paurometabola (strain ATCC 8368 / DSM 20162 / CCUG 35730 / CIP 100753 / JCM 10117 / KCTC 9821 / NBRC 16120 / NCIMB 702349 / NCTC 13040) TaxID=521096 RepID=D5UVM1_TSUPD|nr:hypothetical protein [Tsukamurella paurometabola]ADG79803.1 hypothetical protein Tpau_3216 [Tsukamurella paurometabola DSM 20162]SUP37283.1 Uncharacterised protein [Tsukamurella paurometabola]
MTLTEFLSAISKESRVKRVLATTFYLDAALGDTPVNSATVKDAIVNARVPGAKTWNVPAAFTNAGAYVELAGLDENGRKLWRLTPSGYDHVASFADLTWVGATQSSSRRNADIEQIRSVVSCISDENAKEYANEAVDCLEAEAHRAAIVFMWVAAVHEIQERVFASSTPAEITAAAQKHNPKAKTIKKRDDLVEYNEELLLQIGQDLGVLDKNEKQILAGCLTLRNSSGHPNKYRPGEHKAKAHIEDIVGILFR